MARLVKPAAKNSDAARVMRIAVKYDKSTDRTYSP
jgi:hypothetical protein